MVRVCITLTFWIKPQLWLWTGISPFLGLKSGWQCWSSMEAQRAFQPTWWHSISEIPKRRRSVPGSPYVPSIRMEMLFPVLRRTLIQDSCTNYWRPILAQLFQTAPMSHLPPLTAVFSWHVFCLPWISIRHVITFPPRVNCAIISPPIKSNIGGGKKALGWQRWWAV